MKIENFISRYLYTNKSVTLENIGSFHLSPDVIIPADNEKEFVLPESAIQFEYDRNAQQDEGLVNYIVSQTRKIKPLASSDLESYSILARQFLNIGKPLIIDGIGTLHKSQEGKYEFTQGTYINSKMDLTKSNEPMREKNHEDVNFSSTDKERKSTINIWPYLLLFGLLAAGTAVAYYFINKDNNDAPVVQITAPVTDTVKKPEADSTTISKSTPDSAIQPKADSSAGNQIPANANYTFRVVIKEYSNKILAEKAFAKLTSYGHNLLLLPIDSVRYKLAMPFKSPLIDTARAKDSLRIFFNSKTYVEL